MRIFNEKQGGITIRRYFKYAFATVVAAIGLAACGHDDPDPTPVPKPVEARLATATAESISGYQTTWEADSKLFIGYSADGSAKSVEMNISEGTGTSTGKFSYGFKGELPAPDYAVFPAGIVDRAGAGISDCSMKWPTEQKYGDPSISKVPMWAKCDGLSSLNGPYKFQYIGGILHLSVKGSGSITKVRITSDKPMSGVFQMDGFGNVKFEEGSKSVYYNIDMEGRGNINLSDKAVEFYFSVPAGYYTNFSVDFYGDAGSSYSYKVKDLVEVSRSKVTDIAIDGVKGYGAGKLMRVDAEHDVTYDNIKEALLGMAPGLETLSGAFDLFVKPMVAGHTHISRIIYLTPDRDGRLIEASGLVACQYYSKPGDTT